MFSLRVSGHFSSALVVANDNVSFAHFFEPEMVFAIFGSITSLHAFQLG